MSKERNSVVQNSLFGRQSARIPGLFALGLAVLAAASLPAAAAQGQDMAEFLSLINGLRASRGLSPVCYNAKLNVAAQRHSEKQSAFRIMSHNGPGDGSSVGARARQAGYGSSFVAENIGAGQRDVRSIYKSWETSSGHLRNMLGSQYKFIGLGRAGNYWTLKLGGAAPGESCSNGYAPPTQTPPPPPKPPVTPYKPPVIPPKPPVKPPTVTPYPQPPVKPPTETPYPQPPIVPPPPPPQPPVVNTYKPTQNPSPIQRPLGPTGTGATNGTNGGGDGVLPLGPGLTGPGGLPGVGGNVTEGTIPQLTASASSLVPTLFSATSLLLLSFLASLL